MEQKRGKLSNYWRNSSRIIYEFICHLTQWWLLVARVERRNRRTVHVGPLLIAIMKIICGAVRVKGCAVVSVKWPRDRAEIRYNNPSHLLIYKYFAELRELAIHKCRMEFFFKIDVDLLSRY